MCYKAGPRCQGHAIERHEALSEKASKEWSKVREVENAQDALAKTDPVNYRDSKEYKKLEKKRSELAEKWKETGKELQEAKEEIDATKGGLSELQSKLAQAKANPRQTSEDQMHIANLESRLAKGRERYNAKALAYDKENGTVDCRKPSPYGSPEGVTLLKERAGKAIAKARAATNEADRDKYLEQSKAIVEQIKHARQTRDYVKNGIADSSRASLATNKIELDKVTKQYDRLHKENTEWRKNWEQGDYKEWQDYRKEQLKTRTESRWTVGMKKEEQRLKEKAEASRYNPKNKGINMMELAKQRDTLKARVSWGQKTDEERAETVRRNNAIAADYGKGPGSWTGD